MNSGTNLNDLTDPTKIYRSATTSTIATFTNMPDTAYTACNAECMIFYLPFHTNYGKQVYYGKRNNDWFSYERVWDFNGWSSWDGIGKGEIRFKGPYSFRDYDISSSYNLCRFFEANLGYFSDALCVIALVIGKGGNPLLVFSVKALDYGAERIFFCIHYGGALSIFNSSTQGTVAFSNGWNFN